MQGIIDNILATVNMLLNQWLRIIILISERILQLFVFITYITINLCLTLDFQPTEIRQSHYFPYALDNKSGNLYIHT